MQQVRDIHVRGERRLLVSHDTTVVSFWTVGDFAIPSLSEVLYRPQPESKKPVYAPCVGDECLVLEKEDNGDAMVIAHYRKNNHRQSTHRICDLTSNSDFGKIIQTSITDISEEERLDIRGNTFKKVEVVAKEPDGKWEIQYTAFTGGCFDEAVSVEYALDMESFVRLCDKYRLPFFGSLSGGGYSILAVGELVHNSQTVYGNYDGTSCLVERVPMDTIGSPNTAHVHYLWEKQKILNYHNNILRIYNSKCDGRDCQFATEIWHTSLYDKIMLNNIDKLEPYEFIRLMREVAIGISYSHSKNIAHRAICPQNIVLRLHDKKLLAVPKIRGWSSCTEIDGQSDLVYQDVYGIGLMLFRGLVEPKTSFSIDSYSNAWRSQQKFEDDVKTFKEKNPLAADLVERCLDPSTDQLTALSITDHYVFWAKGRHIYFINRIQALANGKNAIILHHLQLPHDVYVGNWTEKFPEDWIQTRCEGYGNSLLEFVRFVRDTAEHLLDINNTATRKIWATLLVFEVWILKNFPNLFRLLYDAGFAAHAADAWVLAEFFK